MGQAVWIEGRSRSGKTTQLCQQFGEWLRSRVHPSENVPLGNSILVLAANSQTRHHLQQALTNIIAPIATQRNTAFWLECKTPLGFFREAVLLYWPLLVAGALSPVLLPTQIRPEMEQYLALRQWQAFFPTLAADLNDHQQARYVRNLLDVQQLAAAAGLTEAALAERWEAGQFATAEMTITTEALITFTRHWRHWCWQRGLLTYGLIFECYRQHLLPNPTYQQALRQHYDALFADDVDDYPAIAADLFEQLQPQLGWSVMTFNPHGQVRLGINADPEVLKRLSSWTISPEGEKKTPPPLPGLELAPGLGQQMLEILADPTVPLLLPPSVQTLQTENRAQLLREVSQIIITAVQQQQIPPQEIAVIAPGLDDVARYSLLEILQGAGINTAVLNEQWALSGSPLIRSVLTLLALVYDLGHHARREQVAEMFVTLGGGRRHRPFIDPVRAGLLADTCYHVNPDCPQLQPIQTYPRWDRFGFRASQAYDRLREWLARHRQSTSLAPPALLHRMIRELLPPESTLTFSELESLRVLMETLQHFWQLSQPTAPVTVDNTRQAIAEFLQLIDQGIVAARPLPEPSTWLPPSATVTLATIYQYRARRCHHRWQIWLDAGDRLWEMAGVSQLFAAPLFRRGRPPQPWSVTEQQTLNQDRFKRIIFDLTARVTERLILAHSDIGVRGTEQTGQLLGLLDRAETIPLSTVTAN